MEWLWIIQLLINIMVVISLLVWWKERTPLAGRSEAPFTGLEHLEQQASLLEKDAATYKKKTEDQLRFLVQLCEQAHTILSRNAADAATSAASLEEEELRALRKDSADASRKNIPSVQELEARKEAIRAEIPMDLRSLLRDQLT